MPGQLMQRAAKCKDGDLDLLISEETERASRYSPNVRLTVGWQLEVHRQKWGENPIYVEVRRVG